MIKRILETRLKEVSRQYPVVTLTGPRQSGKTTLCRMAFPKKAYVSLENLDSREFSKNDPRGFLSGFPEGAIIDEIQRAPEILSYIQTLVDEKQKNGMFILTGSQQFEVTNRVNQSLAGRTALLKLLPFAVSELNIDLTSADIDRLILTGFYPRIHDQKLDPVQALGDYIETYVERDLRQLINLKDLNLFEKFLKLCSGRIGQLLNLQSLASDTGISHTTARSWISLLEASYIIFLLPPFFRNISRRLIKAPKLYFFDVGLASRLMGLENTKQVSRDPLRGNLFENLVVIEALKFRFNRGKPANMFFFRDSRGSEVDLVLEYGRELVPIEIKSGATVAGDFFKGIRLFESLFPEAHGNGALIYGGDLSFNRENTITAPCTKITQTISNLEKKILNK
ncbi:MAG: ATP-binding protein [Candidatus Riflebacteria bacterium]|nr:ATP-binding protein [Candidatus Riflebacteria bacterium]